MATAASTNKVKRAAAPAAAKAPRRRWWRRTIFLVGIPALLWFAPVIVGFGPILNSIVSMASRDFKGTITVGGASLGWISHIVLHDIEVQDAEGKSLASIGRWRAIKRCSVCSPVLATWAASASIIRKSTWC